MKKRNKLIIFTLVLIMITIFMSDVIAETINYNNLCANDGIRKTMRIIGYVILIARWIVPLIIMVLGMVDFGKAVFSSDEKAINKATTTLIRRIVAGVIVFFIPTIILALLNLIKVSDSLENSNQFVACTECILDVDKCE